jgi:membrane-bound ClpP family serine protease
MMIDNLLKIEKIGKQLLRGGIAIYLVSIVFFTLGSPKSAGLAQFQTGLVGILLLGIIFMLLFHYKNPKAGAIGGVGAILFFLGSALLVGYSDFSQNASGSIIFLHIIKDIILAFGALALTGESVKEMVRLRITKPFPKR